ncbi:MAG: glycosyltransferase [Candidatus Omnitrophica bacterium]|nr:glycosyltransferase [Candidatus Omnitrophota bacterium]
MKKYNLVYLSPFIWEMRRNRSHHIVKYLSEYGNVLFIYPRISIISYLKSGFIRLFLSTKIRKLNKNLFLLRIPPLLPFELKYNLFRKTNTLFLSKYVNFYLKKYFNNNLPTVLMITNPYDVDMIGKFNEKLVIYDCSDDISELPLGKTSCAVECEQQLLKKADFVITVSERLKEKKSKFCKDIYLINNGVEFEHFNIVDKNYPVPSDIKQIKKPVIGYFGVIDSLIFDVELMTEVAESYPDYSFVLIGPADRKVKKILSKYRNVFLLNEKDYDILPSYVKHFDILILPHLKNELFQSASPLKLFEYMATGKKIVSTDFFAVKPFSDFIFVAYSKKEFIAYISEALNTKSHDYKKQIETAKLNDWYQKIKQLNEIILSYL